MTPDTLEILRQSLTATAGGYLRNVVRRESTCVTCFTPLLTGGTCRDCSSTAYIPGLPEARGFVIYAGYGEPISQAGRLMRSYKQWHGTPQMRDTVSLLAALSLRGHANCVGTLVGQPVTAWASVPSLPHRDSEHALHALVQPLARPGSNEIVLRAAPADRVQNPRAVQASHYSVVAGRPDGAHVLIIDDTWTSGGHIQSAALAIRAAGATAVSTLALARWLSLGWMDTTETWLKENLSRPDFDAQLCPWTHGRCP